MWTISAIQLKDVYHKKEISPLFVDDIEGEETLRARGFSKAKAKTGSTGRMKTPNGSRSTVANPFAADADVSATVRELCQTVRELQGEVKLLNGTPSRKVESTTRLADSFELVAIALKEVQNKTMGVSRLVSENDALRSKIKELEDQLARKTPAPMNPPAVTSINVAPPAASGPVRREMHSQAFASSDDLNVNGKRPLIPNDSSEELTTGHAVAENVEPAGLYVP